MRSVGFVGSRAVRAVAHERPASPASKPSRDDKESEKRMSNLFARRLKHARERSGLTQAELSAKLGFKDRQTLAAIEAGQRKLTAEELLRAIEVFQVDLDFFTDSLRLVGEGHFNWRAHKNVEVGMLDSFEDKAGRWIALFRSL